MTTDTENNSIQNLLGIRLKDRSRLYHWSEIESSLKSKNFQVCEYDQSWAFDKITLFEAKKAKNGRYWLKSINHLLEKYEKNQGNKKNNEQLQARLKLLGVPSQRWHRPAQRPGFIPSPGHRRHRLGATRKPAT